VFIQITNGFTSNKLFPDEFEITLHLTIARVDFSLAYCIPKINLGRLDNNREQFGKEFTVFLLIVWLVITWFPGSCQIKFDEFEVAIFVGGGTQKMVYQSFQYRIGCWGTQEAECS